MNKPLFSIDEYRARRARIEAEMGKRNLDAAIITKPDHIYYLCGYRASTLAFSTSPMHCLIITPGSDPILITRKLEQNTVRTVEGLALPRLHSDDESPYAILEHALPRTKLGKIGIEKDFLSANQHEKIKAVVKNTTLEEIGDAFIESLCCPSPAEIENIKDAARIASAGFNTAVRHIEAGAKVNEIVGNIHYAMYQAGQPDLFSGSELGRRTPWVGVWSGPEGGLIHDTCANRAINANDLVTVEIWSTYNHYSASAQGTVYVGTTVPAEVQRYYQLLSEMYVRARSQIVVGNAAEDPYNAANEIWRARFGEDYFRTLGFQMGLGTGKLRLFRGDTSTIGDGTAFRVQAGVFHPFQIVICGTVMATKGGPVELTSPLLELTRKQ